jgi:hypothetical protein
MINAFLFFAWLLFLLCLFSTLSDSREFVFSGISIVTKCILCACFVFFVLYILSLFDIIPHLVFESTSPYLKIVNSSYVNEYYRNIEVLRCQEWCKCPEL